MGWFITSAFKKKKKKKEPGLVHKRIKSFSSSINTISNNTIRHSKEYGSRFSIPFVASIGYFRQHKINSDDLKIPRLPKCFHLFMCVRDRAGERDQSMHTHVCLCWFSVVVIIFRHHPISSSYRESALAQQHALLTRCNALNGAKLKWKINRSGPHIQICLDLQKLTRGKFQRLFLCWSFG